MQMVSRVPRIDRLFSSQCCRSPAHTVGTAAVTLTRCCLTSSYRLLPSNLGPALAALPLGQCCSHVWRGLLSFLVLKAHKYDPKGYRAPGQPMSCGNPTSVQNFCIPAQSQQLKLCGCQLQSSQMLCAVELPATVIYLVQESMQSCYQVKKLCVPGRTRAAPTIGAAKTVPQEFAWNLAEQEGLRSCFGSMQMFLWRQERRHSFLHARRNCVPAAWTKRSTLQITPQLTLCTHIRMETYEQTSSSQYHSRAF